MGAIVATVQIFTCDACGKEKVIHPDEHIDEGWSGTATANDCGVQVEWWVCSSACFNNGLAGALNSALNKELDKH